MNRNSSGQGARVSEIPDRQPIIYDDGKSANLLSKARGRSGEIPEPTV